MPSRRRVLTAVLATGSVIGLPLAGVAQSGPGIGFAAIKVDVRPLVAIGAAKEADIVQQILPAKLRSVFADRIRPGNGKAPLLVAEIDRLYLSAFADAAAPGIASAAMDYIDGAGIVVSNGQIVSKTPLHAPLPASYSGAYYLPDIDLRRIDSLCYQFAYWLPREMNL